MFIFFILKKTRADHCYLNARCILTFELRFSDIIKDLFREHTNTCTQRYFYVYVHLHCTLTPMWTIVSCAFSLCNVFLSIEFKLLYERNLKTLNVIDIVP